MDNSNLSAPSEVNEENSNLIFPFVDNNMLDKLRSCSIIPKELSEFQIFVHTLTGNTISNDIIQEAWRHIYLNESDEEINSNSSIGGTLTTIVNRKCQTSALRCNTSKITQNSGKIRKKMFSPQNIGISQKKDLSERKSKFAGDWSKHVEVYGDITTENNNCNIPSTVHNNVPNLVKDPQPSDSIVRTVRKGHCSSSSVSRTTKQLKVSFSVNEISNYLDEFDLPFSDIPSNSNDLIHNHTLDNDCEDTPSVSHEVESTSRKKVRKNATLPMAITSKQPRVSSPNRNNDVNPNEDIRKDEGSSSDCEVIEIVSLNKSINNGTDSSESELDKCVSDNEKSDSDSSIEILETQCNIKQLINKSEKSHCPVHGKNDLEVYPNSCGSIKALDFVDGNLQPPRYPEKYSHLCFKEKKSKVDGNKKKVNKYELLKNEVETLKSLLVHLLTSLQNPPSHNNYESSDSIPCLFKKEGYSNRLLENCDQAKERDGSFLEGRKKSKRKASQKIKTPLVVEGSASIKGDKSNRRKIENTKNIEDSNDSLKRAEKVDVETSTSDGGKREKFMWREIISDTLKSRPGRQMPVEKLKRMVIAKYYFCRGNVSENTTVKFFRYLHSTSGVIVDRDKAIYSSKHSTKLSSMSEQRKQCVSKTVTTTKEYKIS